jgi:hypothetical protein
MKFKSLVSAAALLTAVGISSSAQADLFVTTGNTGGVTSSNVLFTDNQTAPVNTAIVGTLNNAPGTVLFTSSTDALVTQANGQARLDAVDGSINQLTVDAGSPFTGFSSLILNIDAVNGATNTQIQFTTADQFGGTGFVNSTGLFTLDPAGNNFFTFTSANGQFFDFLSFSTTAGVTVNVVADVNQVRVGALQIVPGPLAGAGLPGLLALGGFVWARRRKAAATA